MTPKYFILSAWLLLTSCAVSAGKISYLQLHVDTATSLTSGQVKLGIVLEYAKGKQRKTKGLMRGIVNWDRVLITTKPTMLVNNGVLQIEQSKLEKSNGLVLFNIGVLSGGDTFFAQFNHRFPTLDYIDIPNEQIKAYQTTELQLMACFSDGNTIFFKKTDNINALVNAEVTLEFPNYVTQQNRLLSYTPKWDDYVKDVPICISTAYTPQFEVYVPTNVNVDIYYSAAGLSGEKGRDGESGQSAPSNSHEGGDGGNGWNGGHGQTPKDVVVFQKKIEDVYLTWLVHVGESKFYVLGLDSKIIISSVGGDGGDGGAGGYGGDGADANDTYTETSGGRGGDGGKGGDAGNGGSVRCYTDDRQYSVTHIALQSSAGAAGFGGKKGKRGKDGISNNDDEGLFSLLVRGLVRPIGMNGTGGINGHSGRMGQLTVESINAEEIEQILDAFGVYKMM